MGDDLPPRRRRGQSATTRGCGHRRGRSRRSTRPTAPICAPSMRSSRDCMTRRESPALLDLEPLRARVERLRCFRGIDDLTALTIAAELGDARRFAPSPAPWRLSAWSRPNTRVGRSGLRAGSPRPATRICGVCSSNRRGIIAIILRRRRAARGQRGAPAAIIAQAWTAQQRLYRRSRRLAARGKSKQHIVTAVARELTGFVWAALTH